MTKTIMSSQVNESMDAITSREERKATGRMVAVIVALLMIFSGFYHAWIKKIPVLAGVMVPALIMLLYAAWVMFLAKREKKRRLNAENQLRHSASALSEILVLTPEPSIAPIARKTRRESNERAHPNRGYHSSNHPHHHHHEHHQKQPHKNCKNHHHKHRHHHQHRPSCGSNEFRLHTTSAVTNNIPRPPFAPLPPIPVLAFDRHLYTEDESNRRRPSAQSLVRSLSAR